MLQQSLLQSYEQASRLLLRRPLLSLARLLGTKGSEGATGPGSAPAAPKGSKQRPRISLCSSAAKLPAAAEEGGSDSVAGSRDSAIVAAVVVDDTDPTVEHAATDMEDSDTGIAGDHADEDGTWNA